MAWEVVGLMHLAYEGIIMELVLLIRTLAPKCGLSQMEFI